MFSKLTGNGRARWARSATHPSEVACLVAGELVEFEVFSDESGMHIERLDEPLHAAVGKCRNVALLWLPDLFGCERLLELLSRSPVNDAELAELRRVGFGAPLTLLRRAIENAQ